MILLSMSYNYSQWACKTFWIFSLNLSKQVTKKKKKKQVTKTYTVLKKLRVRVKLDYDSEFAGQGKTKDMYLLESTGLSLHRCLATA